MQLGDCDSPVARASRGKKNHSNRIAVVKCFMHRACTLRFSIESLHILHSKRRNIILLDISLLHKQGHSVSQLVFGVFLNRISAEERRSGYEDVNFGCGHRNLVIVRSFVNAVSCPKLFAILQTNHSAPPV